MNNQSQELLPCPFCGVVPWDFEDGEVFCSNKECKIRPKAWNIEQWNTRHTPPTDLTQKGDLAKAITRLENDYTISLVENISQFKQDIRTVLDAAKQVQEYQLNAGFCDKHKPNGGARNCLVCACDKLSFALSRISYICGKPNEMQMSDYDHHFNEEQVVKQVEQLRADLKMCAKASNNFLNAMSKWPQGTKGYAEAFQKWFEVIRDTPRIQAILNEK